MTMALRPEYVRRASAARARRQAQSAPVAPPAPDLQAPSKPFADMDARGPEAVDAAAKHWTEVNLKSWPAPNFSPAELRCRGTGMVYASADILVRLERLRAAVAQRLGFVRPLNVNSAYRTKGYNRQVNGARKSRHRDARGFDISMANFKTVREIEVFREEALKLFEVAVDYPRSGFIHIGDRSMAGAFNWSADGRMRSYGGSPGFAGPEWERESLRDPDGRKARINDDREAWVKGGAGAATVGEAINQSTGGPAAEPLGRPPEDAFEQLMEMALQLIPLGGRAIALVLIAWLVFTYFRDVKAWALGLFSRR